MELLTNEAMVSSTFQSDWTAALDETAAEILRRAGVKRPPVNAIEIANRLGCQVLWDKQQSGRARIATVRIGPGKRREPAIFLRPEPRPERIQWAVAHEIGEQCAGKVCRRLGIDLLEARADQREQIANALATRLLLPAKWFAEDATAHDFDLVQLKNRYATASHELIARRMLDLPQPLLVTIFDHGKQQFRRWNRPGLPPSILEIELESWRVAHQFGDVVRRYSSPRIDIWPVHEPDWKREIMRLELPGDGEEFDAIE
jgi:Zn-dependent peptidase ImmA (M78 family)